MYRRSCEATKHVFVASVKNCASCRCDVCFNDKKHFASSQQEQQVQVKTEQDKMEDHARRDTKSLAKPEEQTMTNEAKTDKAAVDGGQLAILEGTTPPSIQKAFPMSLL